MSEAMTNRTELRTVDEVQKLHTSCQNCVFARYAGKTQTGCQLGRIEQFKKTGEVLEATDGDQEFFVINGRVCNAWRRQGGKWALEHQHDASSRVVTETAVKMAAVVVFGEGQTEWDLKRTLGSLRGQTARPSEIFVVNNQGPLTPPKFSKIISDQLGNDFTWRIVRVFHGPDGKVVRAERAVDHAVEQVKESNWYAVFKAGFLVPPDFVAGLDDALNVRMMRFSLLKGLDDGNALVAQVAFHRHKLVGGNEPVSVLADPKVDGKFPVTADEPHTAYLNNLVDKITYYSILNDQPYLVGNVDDVVPSLANHKCR